MESAQNKYQRCLVLAGGGGRLGVHLGTYAAACEAGEPPDLLLGTCGGALVAALIHAEPDPQRQLDILAGPEMYRFWCSAQPRGGASLRGALAGLVRRGLDWRLAPHIPDLTREALYEASGPWPALQWRTDGRGLDTVILGGQLLFDPAEVGQRRGQRALLQPVAIGPARACALVAAAAGGAQAPAGSAVVPQTLPRLSAALPLADAVRISMTDMVYLPPAEAAGQRWLGGVVNLMPVELACQLAEQVWMDRKDPIPAWTMAPAWRAVLGIDAVQRQRVVDQHPLALRPDHRGLRRSLPDSVLARRWTISRQGLQLGLRACRDAADYRRVILAQFEEGRRRARLALAQRR